MIKTLHQRQNTGDVWVLVCDCRMNACVLSRWKHTTIYAAFRVTIGGAGRNPPGILGRRQRVKTLSGVIIQEDLPKTSKGEGGMIAPLGRRQCSEFRNIPARPFRPFPARLFSCHSDKLFIANYLLQDFYNGPGISGTRVRRSFSGAVSEVKLSIWQVT